ncbi:MAG: PqqD family protein [Hyphomicrobium sp.]
MAEIDTDSVIKRKEGYLETELDDEIIIMHINSGHIIGFADTAKEIWSQLSEPISFGKIVDQLVGEFDVDRDTCIAEVRRFLASLENEDMVEIIVA